MTDREPGQHNVAEISAVDRRARFNRWFGIALAVVVIGLMVLAYTSGLRGNAAAPSPAVTTAPHAK
jgi:hypothetical protein